MCGYLRYSLSYRDLEDMMAERGLHVDYTTIHRGVHPDAPKGDEAMNQLRKGQVHDTTNGDIRSQNRFIAAAFGLAGLIQGLAGRCTPALPPVAISRLLATEQDWRALDSRHLLW